MKETSSLRNTAQRKLVYETVRRSYDHPTAETIFKRVSEKSPRISLGTVYRNLSVLTELGLIRRISSMCGPDHYDFNVSEHFHFYCKKCGELSDIPSEFIPREYDLMSPKKGGFVIEELSLYYLGICPNCNRK